MADRFSSQPVLKCPVTLFWINTMTERGNLVGKLYENVQKFLDMVIEQVEDRMLGIDHTGMIDWSWC